MISFTQQIVQQGMDTAVQQIIRLPGWGDQYLSPCPLHLFPPPIPVIHILQNAIPAEHQILFFGNVELFTLLDLILVSTMQKTVS